MGEEREDDRSSARRHITLVPPASGAQRHTSVVVRPTEESLSIAETMAKRLSMPFDRETTRARGERLLAHYYDDIRTVAADTLGDVTFEHGSSGRIEAFAALASLDTRGIFVDEYLQFWLFAVNFLTTFRACYEFSGEERAELARLFAEHCLMLEEPLAHHERLRDELLPLMNRYVAILPAVNALTQCMSVFVICHEIAHHLHDHVGLGGGQSPDDELVADATAYDLLLSVHDARERLRYAEIDTSTLCAPALLLDYFAAALRTLGREDGPSATHPSLASRKAALLGRARGSWAERAETKYVGLLASLDALQRERP